MTPDRELALKLGRAIRAILYQGLRNSRDSPWYREQIGTLDAWLVPLEREEITGLVPPETKGETE